MFKNAIKKKIIVSFITLLILIVIYLIPVNKEYQENISLNNNTNSIYLLNKNKLVKVNSISYSNDTLDKVKEIISSITINNNTYINKDLKKLIPKDTKLLDLSLKDNLLKLNFSKELLSIDKSLEEKLIESLIYSLTSLEGIDKIMIFTEGNILSTLPNSKKILPITLTREYGINKIYDITTLSNTSKVTIYYYTKIDNNYNAVPVTIFTNNDNDKVEVIIKNLKSSNYYQSDLVSFLSNNAKLLDYEILENKIKLTFNNSLLDDFYDDFLIEEVKYALSESFKDTFNLKETEIYINDLLI